MCRIAGLFLLQKLKGSVSGDMLNLLNNTNMINSVIDEFSLFFLLVQERRKRNSCLCPDSLCPLLQVSILLTLLSVYHECLCDCMSFYADQKQLHVKSRSSVCFA
jgi:hypothetical protein